LRFLEARHRARARVEDRILHAKDTGLGRFPPRKISINMAWLTVVAIAADLLAWLRLLALTGALATAEPQSPALPDCCTYRLGSPAVPDADTYDYRGHLPPG